MFVASLYVCVRAHELERERERQTHEDELVSVSVVVLCVYLFFCVSFVPLRRSLLTAITTKHNIQMRV